MKVTTQRVIVIQEDGKKPERFTFTDPSKAAEHWARAKMDEWLEKNKENKKFFALRPYGRNMALSNTLYDEGRVRYRKMKRRALRIFRKIMEVNS
jgi:hypothetical protein